MKRQRKTKAWFSAGVIASIFVFGSTSVFAKTVVPEAKTPTAALGQFVAQDDIGDVYSEVTINLKKDTVYADGEKTDLQEILGVSEAKEVALLDAAPAKVIDYVESSTVCEAEKISANKVVITNNFQTHRLIAVVDEIENAYGAIEAAKGITAYILKYETEEDTKAAYDKLVEEYGEDKIFYDRVFSADEILCTSDAESNMDSASSDDEIETCIAGEIQSQAVTAPSYTSQGYVDTAKTMGMYSINQQINNSKYSKNEVVVAVLDTGLSYTINPNCEIGEKLRDKRKEEWTYVFGGTTTAGDTNGHGTMVSSVIAYNTPNNVKYCTFKLTDSDNKFSDTSIFAAFEQAYILDIDIVNCSFGAAYPVGEEGKRQYEAILKKLYEKGTIVCCAAGNDDNHFEGEDSNGNSVEYDTSADCVIPANSDYVLCVSGLTAVSGNLFIEYTDTNTGNTVDYSAIGVDVYVYTNKSKEGKATGTSLATPLVAAQFAMLKTCTDSFKTVPEMQELYNLYLNPYSVAADSTLYGAGYFDITGGRLCTDNHSKCCGLWHYNDGSSADIGKTHTLTINLNGGTGYGYTDASSRSWSSKFTRTFACGTELCFASAYSYEGGNPNGWIQFGETAKSGSGTLVDPYTPYRKGYMFVGWKCSGVGSVHKKIRYLSDKYREVWYYNGEDNCDITLTAQWMPKKLYNTLTIDPNGGMIYVDGDFVSKAPFTINYKINRYRALCNDVTPGTFYGKAIGEPIREGYTFDKWKTTVGSGFVYKEEGVSAYFTNEDFGYYNNKEVYVYLSKQPQETVAAVQALWIPNTYTITLKAEKTGGGFSSKVVFDKEYGNILRYQFTKEGHTFKGWYTAYEGGEKVTPTTKVTTAADHNLYARWVPNTYKFKLKLNATDTWAEGEVIYGLVYGNLLKSIPTREGYTFNGWYTELEGGKRVSPTTPATIASDHTLYAHWTAK